MAEWILERIAEMTSFNAVLACRHAAEAHEGSATGGAASTGARSGRGYRHEIGGVAGAGDVGGVFRDR